MVWPRILSAIAGFNTFPVFANQAVGRLFANLDFVCVCIIPAIPDDVVVQFPRMKVLLNLCPVRADVQIALK